MNEWNIFLIISLKGREATLIICILTSLIKVAKQSSTDMILLLGDGNTCCFHFSTGGKGSDTFDVPGNQHLWEMVYKVANGPS